jgi:phosphohistidine phosphatase
MRVLLVRHAAAEDQEEFAKTGLSDDERPLTDEGRKEMRAAARGLAVIVKGIDVLAASPLVRAVQTADVVAKEFPDATREVTASMRPGAAFVAFAEWASSNSGSKLVAAVGHNPHISALACWLLGAKESAIDMKKGSALLLEFGGDVREGSATLLWYLKPSQLRDIGAR